MFRKLFALGKLTVFASGIALIGVLFTFSEASAAQLSSSAFVPGCSKPVNFEKLGPSMFNTRTVYGPAYIMGKWDQNPIYAQSAPFNGEVRKTYVSENQTVVFYNVRGTIKYFDNTPACRHNAPIFFGREKPAPVSVETLVQDYLAAPMPHGLCAQPTIVRFDWNDSISFSGGLVVIRAFFIEHEDKTPAFAGTVVIGHNMAVAFKNAQGEARVYSDTPECLNDLPSQAHDYMTGQVIPLDLMVMNNLAYVSMNK